VNQPEPLAGWKRLLLLPKKLLGNSRKRNLVASPSASSDRPSDARFAKVLLGNPEIVLLDQPFDGLQPNAARERKALIRSLASRGKTVVLSSNLFTDASDVCDRVTFLSRGRIEGIGTPQELLRSREALGFIIPF